MTDNEIIQVLKDCSESCGGKCKLCPIFHECVQNDCFLDKQTLDLINRQKAEIESLVKKANTPFAKVTFDENKLKEIVADAIENIEFNLNSVESEAIKKFAEKIDKFLERYSHIHEDAERAMSNVIECDNETIEMQSVWDVHTLIANEMGSEPEEMNRLQDNIETIAKERLLKEIEKDLRLLVKEMT